MPLNVSLLSRHFFCFSSVFSCVMLFSRVLGSLSPSLRLLWPEVKGAQDSQLFAVVVLFLCLNEGNRDSDAVSPNSSSSSTLSSGKMMLIKHIHSCLLFFRRSCLWKRVCLARQRRWQEESPTQVVFIHSLLVFAASMIICCCWRHSSLFDAVSLFLSLFLCQQFSIIDWHWKWVLKTIEVDKRAHYLALRYRLSGWPFVVILSFQ
jgi:hypothetical protein